jgi:hypothetical protein
MRNSEKREEKKKFRTSSFDCYFRLEETKRNRINKHDRKRCNELIFNIQHLKYC